MTSSSTAPTAELPPLQGVLEGLRPPLARVRVRVGGNAKAQGALVLSLYLLLSMLYFGRYALASPAGGTIGVGPDVQIFLWGLQWWPYALEHGLNPLISHVVWAPYGSDILWTTTVPAISLLAAPVTLLLGPTVSWNLLAVLAPALSGWAAYLLCRELTGRLWPSAAGGLLFGFSSYQLAQGLAHLQLTMSACVPLATWVVVRHVRGRLTGRQLAVRLGAVVGLQFLISPEVLLTMLVVGTLAAVGALALVADARRAVLRSLGWVLAGLLAAGVMLSPLIFTMFRSGPPQLDTPPIYANDLLNVVLPTRVTELGSARAWPTTSLFSGNIAEQGAYLGVPLLVILAIFAVTRRASPRARLLLFVAAASLLLSFGSVLMVCGRPTIWLPGALLTHVPVLADALPDRYVLYTFLAGSVILATWLAECRRFRAVPWAMAALVAVSLAPRMSKTVWWEPTPHAITSGEVARVLPPGANVLSLPFWDLDDRSLYAQAAADMHFNLVDGWLQLMPDQYLRSTGFIHNVSAYKLYSAWRSSRLNAFKRSLCSFGINYLIVWNSSPRLLAGLRLKPILADDALVYRLAPCSRPPVVNKLVRGGARSARDTVQAWPPRTLPRRASSSA